jgi:hypothetical protein
LYFLSRANHADARHVSAREEPRRPCAALAGRRNIRGIEKEFRGR